MKYIDRSQVDEPENLRGQAAPTSVEAVDSDIYGHDDVKTALRNLQHGVCCYCESYYGHTTYGDVEHYRPKAYYQQSKGDQQHRPGYYWLAHKWENLMYACEVCNRTYKHNYFPLKDPSKRFDPAVRDISEEEPLLINPYEERNPERHLTFEGTTIKPLTDEGRASIEFYGLDREELNESRQDIYAPIKALEEIVQLAQGTPREAPIVDILKNLIQDDIARGRYTLMIRCNFGEYL